MAEDTSGSHDSNFRRYLLDLTTPRFQAMQKQDACEYAKAFKLSGNLLWLHGLYLHWMKLFIEPFKGITNDSVYACTLLAGWLACCCLSSFQERGG
jgi:hypothetical protein